MFSHHATMTKMTEESEWKELPVTFQPNLYLQRRGWVLDIMRRERVTEVCTRTSTIVFMNRR